MKIADIRVMRLLGPRVHGVGGENGQITKLIIRMDADNGMYGLGEADDFLGVVQGIDYIRAALIGEDPRDIRPAVSRMMYGSMPPYPTGTIERFDQHRTPAMYTGDAGYCSATATPTGPAAWAMSGVEIALCDLAGKAAGLPVYQLLGGRFRDRVRIYLDRSSPKDITDDEAWKRLAANVVEAGFSQLKFDIECIASDVPIDVWNRSIPQKQLDWIVRRIKLVRDVIGWDIELCADCHMLYNVVDAIRLANELAPMKMMWLEDPTPITNPDACAAVREKSPIPICVGEMFIAEQCRMFIDRKACDILHPDVMFTGGLTETRRIAEYAELHYMPFALHGNGGALATIAAAHVAAACRNFLGLEYHFIDTDWIGKYVRREGTPLFANGHVPLTNAPGLGVELDRELCAKHLAPGSRLFE